MKKIAIILIVGIILILIGILFYVNSVQEITRIDSLKICQENSNIKISLFESAFYIKSGNTNLNKNADTLQITLFKTSVYSIGYSNLKSEIEISKNKNVKYIKLCNKLFKIDDEIPNCN